MEHTEEVRKIIRQILGEMESSGSFQCTRKFTREGEAVKLLEKKGVVLRSSRSEPPVLFPGTNFNKNFLFSEENLATLEDSESFTPVISIKKDLKNPYLIGGLIGIIIGIFLGLLLSYFFN